MQPKQKTVVAGQACLNCSHASICIIVKAFAPVMEQLYPKNETQTPKPFKIEDLGAICDFHLNQSIIETLTGGK